MDHFDVLLPYRCNHCYKTFATFDQWKRHTRLRLKRYTGIRKQHRYSSPVRSKVHVKQQLYYCNLCCLLFSHQVYYTRHMNNTHQSVTGKLRTSALKPRYNIECKHCPARFTHLSRFQLHMKKEHLEQQQFQPKKCVISPNCVHHKGKFEKLTASPPHSKPESESTLRKLFESAVKLQELEALKKSTTKNTIKKLISCSECSYRFSNRAAYTNHQKRWHPYLKQLKKPTSEVIPESKMEKGKGVPSCNICGSVFDNIGVLEIHKAHNHRDLNKFTSDVTHQAPTVKSTYGNTVVASLNNRGRQNAHYFHAQSNPKPIAHKPNLRSTNMVEINKRQQIGYMCVHCKGSFRTINQFQKHLFCCKAKQTVSDTELKKGLITFGRTADAMPLMRFESKNRSRTVSVDMATVRGVSRRCLSVIDDECKASEAPPGMTTAHPKGVSRSLSQEQRRFHKEMSCTLYQEQRAASKHVTDDSSHKQGEYEDISDGLSQEQIMYEETSDDSLHECSAARREISNNSTSNNKKLVREILTNDLNLDVSAADMANYENIFHECNKGDQSTAESGVAVKGHGHLVTPTAGKKDQINPFKCSACMHLFSSFDRMKQHERFHKLKYHRLRYYKRQTKLNFLCNTCGKVFRHYQNLVKHKKSHPNNTTTQTKAAVIKQRKIPDRTPEVVIKMIFLCNICGQEFLSHEALKQHAMLYHILFRSDKGDKGHVFHRCVGCGQSFSSLTVFEKHMTTSHMGKKRLPSFYLADKHLGHNSKVNLIKQSKSRCQRHSHKTRITKLKTHGATIQCMVCMKRFKGMRSISKHLASKHPKARRKCPKNQHGFRIEFVDLYSVKTDSSKLWSSRRPFKCLYCSRTFRNSTFAHLHICIKHRKVAFIKMVTVSNVQKLQCRYCSKYFSSFVAILDHKKEHPSAALEFCPYKVRRTKSKKVTSTFRKENSRKKKASGTSSKENAGKKNAASTSCKDNAGNKKAASTSGKENAGKKKAASTSSKENAGKKKAASTSSKENAGKKKAASTSSKENAGKKKAASTSSKENTGKKKAASTCSKENTIKKKIASTSSTENAGNKKAASSSSKENAGKKKSSSACSKENAWKHKAASASSKENAEKNKAASTSGKENAGKKKAEPKNFTGITNCDQLDFGVKNLRTMHGEVFPGESELHLHKQQHETIKAESMILDPSDNFDNSVDNVHEVELIGEKSQMLFHEQLIRIQEHDTIQDQIIHEEQLYSVEDNEESVSEINIYKINEHNASCQLADELLRKINEHIDAEKFSILSPHERERQAPCPSLLSQQVDRVKKHDATCRLSHKLLHIFKDQVSKGRLRHEQLRNCSDYFTTGQFSAKQVAVSGFPKLISGIYKCLHCPRYTRNCDTNGDTYGSLAEAFDHVAETHLRYREQYKCEFYESVLDENGIVCSILCPKWFDNKQSLMIHRFTHPSYKTTMDFRLMASVGKNCNDVSRASGKYQCRHCSKRFLTLDDADYHITEMHNKLVKQVQFSSGKSLEVYQCLFCRWYFADKAALVEHKETHEGYVPSMEYMVLQSKKKAKEFVNMEVSTTTTVHQGNSLQQYGDPHQAWLQAVQTGSTPIADIQQSVVDGGLNEIVKHRQAVSSVGTQETNVVESDIISDALNLLENHKMYDSDNIQTDSNKELLVGSTSARKYVSDQMKGVFSLHKRKKRPKRRVYFCNACCMSFSNQVLYNRHMNSEHQTVSGKSETSALKHYSNLKPKYVDPSQNGQEITDNGNLSESAAAKDLTVQNKTKNSSTATCIDLEIESSTARINDMDNMANIKTHTPSEPIDIMPVENTSSSEVPINLKKPSSSEKSSRTANLEVEIPSSSIKSVFACNHPISDLNPGCWHCRICPLCGKEFSAKLSLACHLALQHNHEEFKNIKWEEILHKLEKNHSKRKKTAQDKTNQTQKFNECRNLRPLLDNSMSSTPTDKSTGEHSKHVTVLQQKSKKKKSKKHKRSKQLKSEDPPISSDLMPDVFEVTVNRPPIPVIDLTDEDTCRSLTSDSTNTENGTRKTAGGKSGHRKKSSKAHRRSGKKKRRKHKGNRKTDGKVTCKYCKDKFNNKSSLEIHELIGRDCMKKRRQLKKKQNRTQKLTQGAVKGLKSHSKVGKSKKSSLKKRRTQVCRYCRKKLKKSSSLLKLIKHETKHLSVRLTKLKPAIIEKARRGEYDFKKKGTHEFEVVCSGGESSRIRKVTKAAAKSSLVSKKKQVRKSLQCSVCLQVFHTMEELNSHRVIHFTNEGRIKVTKQKRLSTDVIITGSNKSKKTTAAMAESNVCTSSHSIISSLPSGKTSTLMVTSEKSDIQSTFQKTIIPKVCLNSSTQILTSPDSSRKSSNAIALHKDSTQCSPLQSTSSVQKSSIEVPLKKPPTSSSLQQSSSIQNPVCESPISSPRQKAVVQNPSQKSVTPTPVQKLSAIPSALQKFASPAILKKFPTLSPSQKSNVLIALQKAAISKPLEKPAIPSPLEKPVSTTPIQKSSSSSLLQTFATNPIYESSIPSSLQKFASPGLLKKFPNLSQLQKSTVLIALQKSAVRTSLQDFATPGVREEFATLSATQKSTALRLLQKFATKCSYTKTGISNAIQKFADSHNLQYFGTPDFLQRFSAISSSHRSIALRMLMEAPPTHSQMPDIPGLLQEKSGSPQQRSAKQSAHDTSVTSSVHQNSTDVQNIYLIKPPNSGSSCTYSNPTTTCASQNTETDNIVSVPDLSAKRTITIDHSKEIHKRRDTQVKVVPSGSQKIIGDGEVYKIHAFDISHLTTDESNISNDDSQKFVMQNVSVDPQSFYSSMHSRNNMEQTRKWHICQVCRMGFISEQSLRAHEKLAHIHRTHKGVINQKKKIIEIQKNTKSNPQSVFSKSMVLDRKRKCASQIETLKYVSQSKISKTGHDLRSEVHQPFAPDTLQQFTAPSALQKPAAQIELQLSKPQNSTHPTVLKKLSDLNSLQKYADPRMKSSDLSSLEESADPSTLQRSLDPRVIQKSSDLSSLRKSTIITTTSDESTETSKEMQLVSITQSGTQKIFSVVQNPELSMGSSAQGQKDKVSNDLTELNLERTTESFTNSVMPDNLESDVMIIEDQSSQTKIQNDGTVGDCNDHISSMLSRCSKEEFQVSSNIPKDILGNEHSELTIIDLPTDNLVVTSSATNSDEHDVGDHLKVLYKCPHCNSMLLPEDISGHLLREHMKGSNPRS